MASTDDRIVQMQFDNASFEKKLDDTIKSLDNLTKALKFEDAKKGFSDIQGAADKFNLNNMSTHVDTLNKSFKFTGAEQGLQELQSSANKFNLESIATHIDGVSAKFLAMSTIAVTALSNITTKAMQTGEEIFKSLSLQPLIDGFKEYELGIGSVQTILANTKSKGTNLDDVSKALDTLNTYSDKTIYNFGQMTRNIGTFTAAGVDLDTSVAAIQGIANLAAISGSSSDQASSAMYQLSQALSAGTLKAQDWISVVNSGMGGEILQKALFQTGQALGTIKDIPLGQTFDEWKAAGNTFKGSLEKGWVTTDVMTTAFNAFSGSMTEAQLVAKGFSKETAAEFVKLGELGIDSATKVRTFTQLMSTTKEAIGSGWSETFKILIGNFEEATTLFTGISTAIGKMVGKSSDARNEMLKLWAGMGGRALLIEALRKAFQDLGEILKPIKDAFREVFPKTTAFDLMNLTKSFELLVIKLTPSKKTIEDIHSIFKGFFSMLQVGWEIIKEGTKFFGRFFESIGAGSGNFLDFLGKIGDFFTELNNKLVEGEGIKNFFEDLTTLIKPAVDIINTFFNSFSTDGLDAAGESIDSIRDKFGSLSGVSDKISGIWEPFVNGIQRVQDVFGKIWDVISNWFKDLGKKLGQVIKPGDFDTLIDSLNVALLGGITALLYNFVHKGIKVDLGSGLFSSITESFKALTGVLNSLQTEIKADAILKIAEAVGILAASVAVLSLIDSDALGRALSAMAIGFTQLMGAFAVLTKVLIAGPKSAATFVIMATGLNLLSTSLLILSAAMFVLSKLSWEEIAKGTTAITALLGVLTGVAVLLSTYSGSFISASIGLTQIAVAINLLAIAMKIFATMTWEEIGKGMTAIGGGLGLIAAALNFMPLDMAITGAGLLAVATSLVILGGAMKLFATLSWKDIGKGLVVVGGGLGLIAAAMNFMPLSTPIMAAGLLMVSVSLIAIGAALKIMGSMSWEEIGRGLVALGGSLGILAVGMTAMQMAVPGAIAIGIVAPALVVLSMALNAFSQISWSELVHGLAAMAGVLAVLGGTAFILQPVIPALMGLGVALVLIGGGFALFGIGVAFMANGLAVLSNAGTELIKIIPDLLEAVGRGIPALATGFAKGLISMAETFTEGMPIIIEMVVALVGKLLDGLVVLIPKALIAIAKLLNGIIEYIGNEGGPKLIKAGIQILLSLLTGIRDNIKEVVKLVADIIKNFLDAFAKEMPGLTDSIANFIISLFVNVAEAVGEVSGRLLFDVGIAFMKGLMEGISEGAAGGIIKWFGELAGNVLGWIGDVLKTLWQKGTDLITGFFGGITDTIKTVTSFFQNLGKNIIGWIGDALTLLKNAGISIITGLFNGMTDFWLTVIKWFRDTGERIIGSFPNPLTMLLDIGKKIIQGLWDGMQEVWDHVTDWLGNLNPAKWFNDINPYKGHAIKNLVSTGAAVMQGLQSGMEDEWDNVAKWLSKIDPASEINTDNMGKTINRIVDQLGTIDQFQPTITPVLDLTEVRTGAQKISDYISSTDPLTVSTSFDQARSIATTPSNLLTPAITDPTQAIAAAAVKFEQNIYAPTQLSTSDIYKQTRNQIAMAKEELSIP